MSSPPVYRGGSLLFLPERARLPGESLEGPLRPPPGGPSFLLYPMRWVGQAIDFGVTLQSM